jgi:chemotaxis protein MotA
LGIGLIGGAVIMRGDPGGFVEPSSILITFGGTIAATIVGIRLKDIIKLVRLVLLVLMNNTPDKQEQAGNLVVLARKARKDGLLALDEDARETEDEFLKKGLELVVDGVEPDAVQEMLDIELESMIERHQEGIGLFRKMASLAPAFGMIGTLIGLVSMLSNLDDPSSIGPGMATALLTTLYGTLLANLFFTPMANKLQNLSEREVAYRELCQAGIMALQSGDTPRIIEQKLLGFLEPSARDFEGVDTEAEGGAAPSAEVAAGE